MFGHDFPLFHSQQPTWLILAIGRSNLNSKFQTMTRELLKTQWKECRCKVLTVNGWRCCKVKEANCRKSTDEEEALAARRFLFGCDQNTNTCFLNCFSLSVTMSWVKSALSSGDDIFDQNADELNLQSKEWISNMKKRVRVTVAQLTPFEMCSKSI